MDPASGCGRESIYKELAYPVSTQMKNEQKENENRPTDKSIRADVYGNTTSIFCLPCPAEVFENVLCKTMVNFHEVCFVNKAERRYASCI